MRVILTSRIFAPEPAAASNRLSALAEALVAHGHDVTVLTVRPPRGFASPETTRFLVRRWPVLRDRAGYVRGYIQYLSYDIPLFFRAFFARGDILVTEPPPTTGAVVRLAAMLRRRPYVYYAADVWSDAVSNAAAGFVVRFVRGLERFALNGAAGVLSVSAGVTERLRQLGVQSRVETIGNGIDTAQYGVASGERPTLPRTGPYLVYAGTASEVHGATVFIEAFALIAAEYPDAILVFIGHGAERDAIEHRAAALADGSTVFLPRLSPAHLAPWLRNAAAALASVRPDVGYDFALPTKVYAALAAGAPVLFSGVGPAVDLLDGTDLGEAVGYDPGLVADAMRRLLDAPFDDDARAARRAWARDHIDVGSVSSRAVEAIVSVTGGGRG